MALTLFEYVFFPYNVCDNRSGSHRWLLGAIPKNCFWHQHSKHRVLSPFSNLITLTNTWLIIEIIQRAEEKSTYDFDAVARSGGECPGAWLLAGVFIWPIGAGNDTTHTIHGVITASCKKHHWVNTGLCMILKPNRLFDAGRHVLIDPNGHTDQSKQSRTGTNMQDMKIEGKYLLCNRVCSREAQSHSCTDNCSSQRCWHTHVDSHRSL